MFFFKYVKNKKLLIILYKFIFFIFLIYTNSYNSIFLTIAKNSTYIMSISLFFLIIFSYEFINYKERLNFHKLFSKIFIIYSFIHTFCHIYLIIMNIYVNNFTYMYYFTTIYITGFITIFLLLIIFIFSLKSIRKNFFNIFYYNHLLVYLILFIFIFHSTYYIVFFILLIIKPIYFILFKYKNIEKNEILLLTDKFVFLKLFFKKKQNIAIGDCIYLNCKNISKFEKHPFTVIDSNFDYEEEKSLICNFSEYKNENYISVCISNNGDWKSKFISTLIKNKNYDLHNNGINLKLFGYYQTNFKYLKKYDTLIFFCENIGITPFLSFIYFLRNKKNQNKIYNIVLYFQIENTQILKLLYYILSLFNNISCVNISYNIYIRNEDVFNLVDKNSNYNFFKGKINFKNIINLLENNKKSCIYFCGNSKTLFKINFLLYNLKKNKIKLLYG